jgi:hypothetical protein
MPGMVWIWLRSWMRAKSNSCDSDSVSEDSVSCRIGALDWL